MGIGGKCKRSMQISESLGKEPKEFMVERRDKSCSLEKRGCLKGVLTVSDEEAKERCMEAYREDKRKVKRCIIRSKKESK